MTGGGSQTSGRRTTDTQRDARGFQCRPISDTPRRQTGHHPGTIFYALVGGGVCVVTKACVQPRVWYGILV